MLVGKRLQLWPACRGPLGGRGCVGWDPVARFVPSAAHTQADGRQMGTVLKGELGRAGTTQLCHTRSLLCTCGHVWARAQTRHG